MEKVRDGIISVNTNHVTSAIILGCEVVFQTALIGTVHYHSLVTEVQVLQCCHGYSTLKL